MNKYFFIFIMLVCSTAYSAEQSSVPNVHTSAASAMLRCGFPQCFKTFKNAHGLHIHQSKSQHILHATASATATAAAAIAHRKKDTPKKPTVRKKKSKVVSDDDYCSEDDSASEENDDDFSDDEADAQSPLRKVKTQRAKRKGQYGDSKDYGCGIEGCLSRFGHERNVWEHWRNIHKLKAYYACPLNCAGARYSHWGPFKKHINEHTSAEYNQMPDKYKVDKFPGYPLLPDDEIAEAQRHNLGMSRKYKKARTIKAEPASSSTNADTEPEVSPEIANLRAAIAQNGKNAKNNDEALLATATPEMRAKTVAAIYASKKAITKATQPPSESSSSSSSLTASQTVLLRSLRRRTAKPSIAAALTLNAAQPVAAKKPTSDEVDDQHDERETRPKKLIPMTPLPLPATAQPSKVLTASDVMNEVPLTFDAYLREKRSSLESLKQSGKIDSNQLKQLRNLEELDSMNLQIESLIASNID